MFAQERHQAITDLLAQHQKMMVAQLQEALGVSPATLRRDLAELEADGQVIRVRGAVVHPAYFRGEPTLLQKSRAAGTAKRAIAEAAIALVDTRSTVFVDSGTTCLEAGRLLLPRADVTILTNSLPLASLAAEQDAAAKVICIGGELRTVSGALVGGLGLSWLQNLHADWAFIGASGLSLEAGASTTELSEATMKQQMLRCTKRRVLLADARKWNEPATVAFAPWSEFEIWITDGNAEIGEAMKIHETRVQQVKENGKS